MLFFSCSCELDLLTVTWGLKGDGSMFDVFDGGDFLEHGECLLWVHEDVAAAHGERQLVFEVEDVGF